MIKRSIGMVGVFSVVLAGAWALAHGNQPGMAKLTVPSGEIVVDYVGPELKGRDINALIRQPGANPWRMGADKPTTLSTPVDIHFGEGVLGSGTYVLRAYLDDEGEWWLQAYDQSRKVVGKMELEASTSEESMENLEITLEGSAESAHIRIHWGTQVLTGSLSVAD